jgi:hypothetical protein
MFLPTQQCLKQKLGFVFLIFSKIPLCAKMVLTTRTCRKKHSFLMKENDNLQLSQIQRSSSPLRRLLPLGRRSCPKVCSFFAILAKQKVCQSTYLSTTSLVTRSIENSHKLSCFYHVKDSWTIWQFTEGSGFSICCLNPCLCLKRTNESMCDIISQNQEQNQIMLSYFWCLPHKIRIAFDILLNM